MLQMARFHANQECQGLLYVECGKLQAILEKGDNAWGIQLHCKYCGKCIQRMQS